MPKSSLPTLAALVALLALITGCGESGGPDPKAEQAKVDAATEVRSIYVKSGGDYSKLDPGDRAKVEKFAGSPAEAEKLWGQLKTGPGGGASTGPGQ